MDSSAFILPLALHFILGSIWLPNNQSWVEEASRSLTVPVPKFFVQRYRAFFLSSHRAL